MFALIQAAGWPIWFLLICSVVCLALVIERFICLQKDKILPNRLLEDAMTVSRTQVPVPKVVAQLRENSKLGEVLASGLQVLQDNPQCTPQELRSAMEGAGRGVTHQLEKRLTALGTIASAAPLLGLLGTVIGMIEIFGAQSPNAGGTTDPLQLAHGISIALYNTAFGLMIAIPALIFWRYFRARVDAYILQLELAAERFMRHLQNLCTPAK